jgi:hypothetical protein
LPRLGGFLLIQPWSHIAMNAVSPDVREDMDAAPAAETKNPPAGG